MAGLLVGLLLLMGFLLVSITGDKPASVEPPTDPKQIYIQQQIRECDRKGGIEKLDPISGALGCDLPIKR